MLTIRSDGKGRGARGRWLGALVVCALAAPFGWAAQGEHLVISEVGYDTANEGAGASSEFVEIFNPTDHAIDLSNYYLSDDPRSYALVSDFNYSTTGNLVLLPTNSDFIHRFPDGLTIPSGGVVVVCADAQTFLDEFFGGSLTAFHAQQGYPQLVQCNRNGLASVPRMRPAATNNSQTSNPLDGLSLTNSGEVVILFHWDQSSDLVEDVDVVAWGSALSQSPPLNVDKDADFGGGVDGPDPDANASMYQPDAGAPASYAAPRVRQGNSIVRLSLVESQEVTSGGNGITGHDESSEDWSVFGDEAASPGTTTLGVPELHVLATQLDFGRVAVGGEASVELAIENTGLRDLVVRGWSVSGTDAAAFSVDSGDLVVAPGTTERRSVRLRPQAMGPHAAELALVTNDPAQPSVRVDLRGEGASPPVLRVRVDGQSSGATGGSVNVQALSFPDTRRTRQSTLDLVIENAGGADLHVTQIRLDGKNAADFQIDASPAVVVAGARLVRTVTFAPLAEGQREATLTLVTDDPNAASYGVALEGTGLEAPRPLAVLVTPSLTFPSTSTDRPVRRELRVRNDGSDTLSLTAAQLDGAQAAVFGVVLESTSVAPGEEVAVPVTFHPTRAGRYEASVRIATDDPDSPELVASLQGAALARSSGGGGGGCRLAPGSGGDTGILPIVLALLALAGWRRRDG